MPPRTIRIAETVLTLGLNLVIAKLRIDPRWRYAVWALIALNELRGLAVVYEFGAAALTTVS